MSSPPRVPTRIPLGKERSPLTVPKDPAVADAADWLDTTTVVVSVVVVVVVVVLPSLSVVVVVVVVVVVTVFVDGPFDLATSWIA
ncbi:MAG: hypothetical protein KIT84_12365 [Labilithrix sp.]|nr:hypothetical protein [Labilithrix sp.]MCW5811807.1 hypothetical protein [Labilithrix sp.]